MLGLTLPARRTSVINTWQFANDAGVGETGERSTCGEDGTTLGPRQRRLTRVS